MSAGPAKVRRVPAMVEFYHSLMWRDSRRDFGAGATKAGKTRATLPATGETNQRQRIRTSSGGDEPAAGETKERCGDGGMMANDHTTTENDGERSHDAEPSHDGERSLSQMEKMEKLHLRLSKL
ncbi:hypothetical protein ACOSP7_005133 [Xanthoceras sorbifolium]